MPGLQNLSQTANRRLSALCWPLKIIVRTEAVGYIFLNKYILQRGGNKETHNCARTMKVQVDKTEDHGLRRLCSPKLSVPRGVTAAY